MVRFQSYYTGQQPSGRFLAIGPTTIGSRSGRDLNFYFSGGADNYIEIRDRWIYPVSEVVSLDTGTTEVTLIQLAYGLGDDGYRLTPNKPNPHYVDRFSPEIPPPPNRDRSSWGVQMNASLDNIQSRLDSEAEMRRIEEERVAQEARAKADRRHRLSAKLPRRLPAAVAEAEAVRLAAESQARVDAIKLAALRKSLNGRHRKPSSRGLRR